MQKRVSLVSGISGPRTVSFLFFIFVMIRRNFSIGEEVEARYEGGHSWHDARIIGRKGTTHYEIEFKSG